MNFKRLIGITKKLKAELETKNIWNILKILLIFYTMRTQVFTVYHEGISAPYYNKLVQVM